MEMINLKINGLPVSVEAGTTLLDAARKVGIKIPTLCYLREINAIGSCRVCVVEIKGARSLAAACVMPASEGMEVFTNTPAVQKSRKMTLELILSNHDKKCLSCVRNQNCELQQLASDFGVEDGKFEGKSPTYDLDKSTPYLVRDNNKCILCRRCVAACKFTQEVSVIGANDRGMDTHIGCAFEKDMSDIPCVACGQCTTVCPTAALVEKDDTDLVWKALANPDLHVIVATAPAVRVALGEEFDMPVGTNVKGKMVSALRRLGFQKVFDVDFTADLTIMEEGTEFLHRLQNGGKLPLITSCSPGWIKFVEHYYPEYLENISTCKSPQQMFGAVAKTYYAEKMGIDPEKIFVVSIMPCTAKKFERTRDNQAAAGCADIDAVLTTRELARMIKKSGMEFEILPNEEFDNPFGMSTGAAVIFGATGGVMEAALRTLAEIIDKKPLESLDFMEVRGIEGVKEATYVLGGIPVKVAVASGLVNAKAVMEKIKNGEAEYHFVEIMACPGGCVNGGGQPVQPGSVRNYVDLRVERANAIYQEDRDLPLRKSHENPFVTEIYKDYFNEPGSHKAHKILHTKYVARKKY